MGVKPSMSAVRGCRVVRAGPARPAIPARGAPYAPDMTTLLVVVHVLAAIFVIGPLCVAPLTGLRGIRRRDPDRVHAAARQTALFGAGSVVVGALGAAAVAAGDRYDFTTPWVTISATLYVVALVITFAATVPALRGAARVVGAGTPQLGAPPPPAGTDADRGATVDHDDTGLATTADDLFSQSKLDSAQGRVGVSAVAMLLIFAAIAVLMVTKPFSG